MLYPIQQHKKHAGKNNVEMIGGNIILTALFSDV